MERLNVLLLFLDVGSALTHHLASICSVMNNKCEFSTRLVQHQISHIYFALCFISVGTSMQDFAKEDYNFLSSGCDKDASLVVANDVVTSPLERIKLAKTPDLIEAPESIKLEDSSIYSWHTTTTDIGSNLL